MAGTPRARSDLGADLRQDGDVSLLSTIEMATFAARGFLALPGVIPDDVNVTAAAEMQAILSTWGTPKRPFAPSSGQPVSQIYPAPSAIGEVLRHPRIAGAIASLVGGNAVFDHDFVHVRPPRDPSAQFLHSDAIIDPNLAFDIQLFYFPHEVTPDGGGTGYVPGTHLRRVNEMEIGRYRHVAGEQQWSGPAGSVLIFHHGLWHRGMANPSDTTRLMYKARLNPTTPQIGLWDTSDLADAQGPANDHVFATFDTSKATNVLRQREPWMGEPDYRLEIVNRVRLWRYLTGDDSFDLDWYLTRLEARARLTGVAPR